MSDNITKRTFANCAAFNPAPTRAPGPSDSCNSHQTYEEALEQGAFIDAHRDATWTQTHLKRE